MLRDSFSDTNNTWLEEYRMSVLPLSGNALIIEILSHKSLRVVSPTLNTSQTDYDITMQHLLHPLSGALCSVGVMEASQGF